MKSRHLAFTSLAFVFASFTATAMAEDKVVKIEFPKPLFQGTPVPASLPNLEKPDPSKIVKEFKVPSTASNLAKGKLVGSSDPAPIIGELTLITDGDADGSEGKFVEVAPGQQWVQIDLGASATVHKIVMWHFHKQAKAYKAVIVQVSDDPEFKTAATTVWNSDDANTAGLGAGKDPTYVETNHGRVIDAKDAKGRFVRFYSNGSTADDMNHYVEIEVWGTPAAK